MKGENYAVTVVGLPKRGISSSLLGDGGCVTNVTIFILLQCLSFLKLLKIHKTDKGIFFQRS